MELRAKMEAKHQTATVCKRKHYWNRAAGLLVSAIIGGLSFAQAADPYPQRPVKVVVPYSAGGGTDATARLFAAALEKELGQAFIVENRPGGASIPGTQSVAIAAPDGYTLGMMDSSFYTNPALFGAKLPYNTERDFKPVALLARNQLVLVVLKGSPYSSVADLVAAIKSKPGQLAFASAGIGTGIHLAGEQFRQAENLNFVTVPYRGGGPALADFLGGRVDFSFVAYPLIRDHLAAGTVRPLGVAGPRMVHDTTIPSLSEPGLPSVDAMTEMGLIAPAQTPDEIVERISKIASEAAQRDPLKKRLLDLGSAPLGSTPKEYSAHVAREMKKWSGVIERGNIKPD